MKVELLKVHVSESIGSVSAEVLMPASLKAMLTLAHGAGADMNHKFMKALSNVLAEHSIGTMRFNFPYIEKGKKLPDPPAIAEKTVGKIIDKAIDLFPSVPLFGAGKSFGGRMTSRYVSSQQPPLINGLIFYGFPLHPAGKPSKERAEHLAQIKIPMLFLQGTKDALAETALIKSVVDELSQALLTLFEGADHSFKVGKRELIGELADKTSQWIDSL